MSIFRKSEEVPPVQVEGSEAVSPRPQDEHNNTATYPRERKRLPKTKWFNQ